MMMLYFYSKCDILWLVYSQHYTVIGYTPLVTRIDQWGEKKLFGTIFLTSQWDRYIFPVILMITGHTNDYAWYGRNFSTVFSRVVLNL